MASLSVKDRVAMFSHGGEDDNGAMSPATPSFKRPSTPNSQPFRRPTTPNGQGLRPVTPNGRSFNKAPTPTGKSFNRTAANESPKGNRTFSPWPAEDDGIPAPKQGIQAKRYSSSYLPQSDKPAILPSPKANSSGNVLKIQSMMNLTPLKHIHNQDAKGFSSSKKTPGSPAKRFDSGTIKPVILPSASRAASPTLDENKAPRANDMATQRVKALQLAKSRNSVGSSIDAKTLNSNLAKTRTASNSTEDDSSSHSSETDNELSKIANDAMTLEKAELGRRSLGSFSSLPTGRKSVDTDSIGTEESSIPAPGGKQGGRLSRVGKLSQANRRAGTPESAPDLLAAATNSRSQSPLPAVRGTRTVSKVSHQEARKALLQAAQRQKEKADTAKHMKEKAPSVELEEQKLPAEHSTRSQNAAADRLALKAANVLAIKNSTKILFGHQSINTKPEDESHKDTEGSVSGSVVSLSSEQKRRKNHPAFAARSSPKVSAPSTKEDDTAKPFSEELFKSFRHFSDFRPEMKISSAPENTIDTTVSTKNTQGRPPHPHAGASPMSVHSPKTLKQAMAAGSGSVLQSFEYSQASPSNTGRFSIDSTGSPCLEQEESLHSTSDRNFDRRIDVVGHPKYAPSKQTFQQQEGGYLSSLSTHTYSTTSMISSANDAPQVGNDGPNPLGEMSPRVSMRSGHSLAQSIVSMSPRVETSKQNSDFEYLLNTPSGRAGIESDPAGKSTPSGVPPQIDEEEGSEPTTGPSVEAPSEPTVGSSQFDDLSKGGQNPKSTVIPIQMSYSAAEAPPGFVFHDDDTEGSEEVAEKAKIRDPAGRMSFDAQGEDVQSNEDGHGLNVSTAERSSSTKGTVSTSIRTGLSGVQNGTSGHLPSKDHIGEDINIGIGSPREGSTSIRTGLSGLQNGSDLEGSASMRSTAGAGQETTETASQDPPQLTAPPAAQQVQPKRAQFPDTIVECDDEEASGIKSKADEKPVSLLGHQTATTTVSSSGGSGKRSESEGVQTLLPAALLAPINTRNEKTVEEFSVASSPASSKHSRWKVKMPNMIKSVLAKASPRNTMTPRDKVTEKTGFSTSEDEEDDDLFAGLEDAPTTAEVPKKASSTKSGTGQATAKRPASQPPTPNRFFNSGHSRKTEPPRINDNKETVEASRRSLRSVAKSKPIARVVPKENKLSLKGITKRLTSPKAAEPTTYGLYSNNNNNDNSNTNRSNNDRSGTYVEQVVQEVNSDITSSIIAGPFQKGKLPLKKDGEPEDEIAKAKTPKAKTIKKVPVSTKSQSSKKLKTPKRDNQSVSMESKKTADSKGKDTLFDNFDETETKATKETFEEPAVNKEEKKEKEPAPSMFMNIGCGLSDAYTALASVCHFGGKDEEEPEVTAAVIGDDLGTFISADSNNTSSHLTDIEKRVWNEWDKLDSAFKATKSPTSEKKEDLEKKRDVARGKLLDIANSAISSQMTKEGDQSGASESYTSSYSGDTGESSGMTGSQSHSSGSYVTGTSDLASDVLSMSVASKATATPILLSFSQRSLIEKFSKQLGNVGVAVLKLNRRKQWQLRYFTVSKEQIALIAHEANSKSGAEVAQCPKALLWLKKFNSKGGGYSLANIDKSGHGGMLLVDLKDILVSQTKDIENPIPKKLGDKFKDSVLVSFEYQFKNQKRHIEFRCKDNDEAQFLCTCMRVIRDLLKREQALRQKTQQAKTPKK